MVVAASHSSPLLASHGNLSGSQAAPAESAAHTLQHGQSGRSTRRHSAADEDEDEEDEDAP